ncbi:energy transducer TonB [Rhizorhabdus sp. FW153]|uniref:energy transducer TonB n=1 Tax=Rhizorhabdus sp. FW153 TaxID=3400216 RepID=UPI003CEFEDE8
MTVRFRNLLIGLTAATMVAGAANAAATPEWTARIRQMIASKQDYPNAAQMRGDEGTAKVKLDVSDDGSVAAASIVQPSGSALLDKEALAAIKRVGNFPAPPGGAVSVVVPLTWKLQ